MSGASGDAIGVGGAVEAGRELDAMIAERLFGRPRGIAVHCERIDWQDKQKSAHSHPNARASLAPPPPYSTDIAAAWSVVEKMDERCCDFTLEKAGTAWYADFRVGSASADTAPLAICLAALNALATSPRSAPTESAVPPVKNEDGQ